MAGQKLALVHNPGGKARPMAVAATAPKKNGKRKTNAAKKAVKVTPKKRKSRKSNPAGSIGSLMGGAAMAAAGVIAFDIITSRVLGNGVGAYVKAGVKIGGAALLQSSFGKKIPVLGTYHKDIALVLAVLGAVDLYRLLLAPMVNGLLAQTGLVGMPAEGMPAEGMGYDDEYEYDDDEVVWNY